MGPTYEFNCLFNDPRILKIPISFFQIYLFIHLRMRGGGVGGDVSVCKSQVSTLKAD